MGSPSGLPLSAYLVEDFLELAQVVRVFAAVVKRHAAQRRAAAARARAARRAHRAAARREARFAELAVPLHGPRHNVDPLVVGRVKVVLELLLVRSERKRKRLLCGR